MMTLIVRLKVFPLSKPDGRCGVGLLHQGRCSPGERDPVPPSASSLEIGSERYGSFQKPGAQI